MVRQTILLATLLLTGLPAAAQTDADPLRDAAMRLEERQADAWLASMEAQLQLSAAQQDAFAAYAAAIRAQAELKATHTAVLFVGTAQLPPAPEGGTTTGAGRRAGADPGRRHRPLWPDDRATAHRVQLRGDDAHWDGLRRAVLSAASRSGLAALVLGAIGIGGRLGTPPDEFRYA